MNYVGIDIGTTRIKVSVLGASLNEVLTVSRPSPAPVPPLATLRLAELERTIDALLEEVCGRARSAARSDSKILGVAVSAHAPSLCAVDRDGQGTCWSYLGRGAIGAGTNRGSVTERWLATIGTDSSVMHQLVSLTAFVNCRLGGSPSLDPITAWELGIEAGATSVATERAIGSGPWGHRAVVPILPPTRTVGRVGNGPLRGAQISSGTTDSVASLVGSVGSGQRGMVYAGTFGCVLLTSMSPRELPFMAAVPSNPYAWVLSVPNLGPKLSSLADQADLSVPALMAVAKSATNGDGPAGDALVPWFGSNGVRGAYQHHADPIIAARQIVETFGFLLRYVLEANGVSGSELTLTGGLTESDAFCEMLVRAHGAPLLVGCHPHGSYGAGLIAAASTGIGLRSDPARRLVGEAGLRQDAYDAAYHRAIERHVAEGWRPRGVDTTGPARVRTN